MSFADKSANAENTSRIRAELRNELHIPGRADRLEPIENHLTKSANLARALWRALSGDSSNDKRDLAALTERASAVADHTSAAVYIFDMDAFKIARKQ